MRAFLGEVLDPIKDFYHIRTRTEKCMLVVPPIVVGIISLICSVLITSPGYVSGYDFANDIVGHFITILTLFISFNMGYLTLILTSNSKNVEDMKGTYSEIRFKDKRRTEPYNLYEILTSEVTYTLLIEIGFLILCVAEKIMLVFLEDIMFKAIISIDIMFFLHIAIMLLVIVKNVYFSFWKSV